MSTPAADELRQARADLAAAEDALRTARRIVRVSGEEAVARVPQDDPLQPYFNDVARCRRRVAELESARGSAQ